MAIRIIQRTIETLPMGEYVAVVKSLDSETRDFGRGDQEQVRWFFACETPAGVVVDVPGWCSAIFTNRSKLYAWTKAVLGGGEMPRDYNFNSDDMVGRKVIVALTVKDREDGSDFNRVDRLLPVRDVSAEFQTPLPFQGVA